MERIFSNKIIEEYLKVGINKTKDFQVISYITPDGKFLKIYEHYEVIRWLVQVRQLLSCDSDAEQLLSDLGYIKYSYIGYITLADKEPTPVQYKALRVALENISQVRDTISLQLFGQSRFYLNVNLDDIESIIIKIKQYYSTGQLV